MLYKIDDQSHRFGAVLVAGMVLVMVLSGVLPALAAVVLISLNARPGSGAGEVIVRLGN